jgi:tetrathionate reductase subunit A
MAKLDITRRGFLKGTAVGCGALALSQMDLARGLIARAEAGELTAEELYALAKAENQIQTVCLNCNTGCGIKVKILDGVAAKIDGNPYSPWTLHPHLPMTEPLSRAARVDGAICPKGQAGHQGAYDPYRIRTVLKRAGRRGEGKWQSISFDKAIDEIVNGGLLFATVPGEEMREVPGLKALMALRDPKVFDEMGADVAKIRKKKMTVAEFKAKHAANLDKLIDADHPDFGPKNNQFVYMWGRKKGGRSDFSKRFYDAFGTANTHGHTTVCQGSLYFACKAMSEQYVGDTFKDGQKFYWQADLENSEYVIFVGSNLFDANYGPPNRTPRITQRLVDGSLKIAVLDPRMSKLASRAPGSWIPVMPGTDAAFAMGMTRWIFDNERFDAKFLANANKAAAAADKESTWSNGPWLVKLGKDGVPGGFLRASEIGLKAKDVRKDKDGKEFDFEYLVVLKDGKPVAFDPSDEKEAVEGDLFVDAELPADKVGVVRVKSGLQIMRDVAREKTLVEYAEICGIEAKVIESVAREFTSHGKKAAVDMHRGPAQHTNGFYNISSLMNLNLLVGNFDWAGGMIAASTWNYDGTKTDKQPFSLKKLTPTSPKPFGLSIIRHDAKYEESTIFEPAKYPAKRNWWPLSSDVYEEILPSIADAYPYGVKALFSYMAAPTYSLPAGHTNIEALTDLEKLPLYFASDITIGVTSMYADYLFPDLHYLERWEFHGSHPNMSVKVQPVRQPVIASPNEIVKVFGEEQPISYETVWMALAEKLGLPGFGKDGFGPGQDFRRPDDFYIRLVANIAFDGKDPVADASEEDLKLFSQARRHLPKNVFDQARWEKACGAAWPKVVTVLTRGGRFDTLENSYKGAQVANKYGKLINLYQEKTAKSKDAFTGKPFFGLARYLPQVDTLGREPTALRDGFDFHMITQRDVLMTKSRTITARYLTSIKPENAILVNGADAKRLGLANGAKVKVVSATNPEGIWDLKNGVKKPMVGVVQVTETIRPGIITFSVGFGHWATGAADMVVDGKLLKGDPHRATGIHANAAMWVDPHLKNTCFIDKVGGSVSFYDTKVKLVPA